MEVRLKVFSYLFVTLIYTLCNSHPLSYSSAIHLSSLRPGAIAAVLPVFYWSQLSPRVIVLFGLEILQDLYRLVDCSERVGLIAMGAGVSGRIIRDVTALEDEGGPGLGHLERQIKV